MDALAYRATRRVSARPRTATTTASGPRGHPWSLPAIVGHRDVTKTSCPGTTSSNRCSRGSAPMSRTGSSRAGRSIRSTRPVAAGRLRAGGPSRSTPSAGCIPAGAAGAVPRAGVLAGLGDRPRRRGHAGRGLRARRVGWRAAVRDRRQRSRCRDTSGRAGTSPAALALSTAGTGSATCSTAGAAAPVRRVPHLPRRGVLVRLGHRGDIVDAAGRRRRLRARRLGRCPRVRLGAAGDREGVLVRLGHRVRDRCSTPTVRAATCSTDTAVCTRSVVRRRSR